MATSQFVSVRETAQILGISEKKVMDLISDRELQAYRIADKFLRLKKNEVLSLRNTGEVENESVAYTYTSQERLRDFLYFNDFYIFSSVIICVLLFVIFKM